MSEAIEGCKCFHCRHKEDEKTLEAYYQGKVDALENYHKWLIKDLKIPFGKVGEENINSLVTCLDFETGGDHLILDELKERNSRNRFGDLELFVGKNEAIKDISDIKEDKPFLAFYKKFDEYTIFIKRKDKGKEDYQLIEYGTGFIMGYDFLSYVKSIMYMDEVLNILEAAINLRKAFK